MAVKTHQARKWLQILQKQLKERLALENKLKNELSEFFGKLEEEITEQINDTTTNKDTILNTINDKLSNEFKEILLKYSLLTMKLTEKQTDILIEEAQKKRLGQKKSTATISFKELPLTYLEENTKKILQWISTKAQTNLDNILYPDMINIDAPYKIETNHKVQKYLEKNTITVSQKTQNRITNEIQEILAKSETEGIGNREVGHLIQERFKKLRTYEAERIARTEINSANNLTAYQRYLDNKLVDYNQWISTNDSRTRYTHKAINGEITRVGHKFSNGLQYPGDKNGPLQEFINCRCTIVPWFPDFDKMPPTGMAQFKEKDCIPLPPEQSGQVTLQLDEDAKLYEVRQGALQINNGIINKLLQQPVEKVQSLNSRGIKPILPKKEVDKLSLEELADYYEVEYQGLVKYEYDGKKYHQFIEKYEDTELVIRFEEGAITSFNKKGIATPQEIIQEVLQCSKTYKRETTEVWFKNTNAGIEIRPTKTGFDSLGANVGGYNSFIGPQYKGKNYFGKVIDSPDHSIVINPKYFKGANGKHAHLWKQKEGEITNWKWTIHHEFAHSSDYNKQLWLKGEPRLSSSKEYMDIHLKEKYFTKYANTKVSESYAEHGGYVDFMLTHPEEQTKTITIELIEKGKHIQKDINFEEYKEMFPEHYKFFKNLVEGNKTKTNKVENVLEDINVTPNKRNIISDNIKTTINKIEGKDLNLKEKRILKDLQDKHNNIKQNKITKEDNTKAIQKQHKTKNKELKEKQTEQIQKENNINQIQTSEKELHNRFRRENKKIVEKMDEHQLVHGEYFHYVTDDEGKIYIDWNPTKSKDAIDDFYIELAPKDELYKNKHQKQAIDAYTEKSFGPFNAMYRITKQMKQMGKHREEIIEKYGIERWNKIRKFYKTKMQTEYKNYLDKNGNLENFFHTREAYNNKSYNLKMNTRLYHGQDKWYGKPPKVGDEDTLGQYLSTSHNEGVAIKYAKEKETPVDEQVIIEIDAPKCTKAMPIINRGKAKIESEFLLRYDQKYKVTKVFTDNDGRMRVRYKLLGGC